ncbi:MULTISPECIES: hypothetical protein [Haloferax]|nr:MULTISPECIES: hypothetical protein [Haloferax]KAB1185833.1 hypothetical protein Hfx1149_14535 [Haloferax sp. CBA1149]KAB1186900.1 hypothetical protein Hfx1149_02195 [Haloferax sp. CBA1149]KAB1187790.1 hypothetical protein Hfx1149_06980 [Haloferax sp. CBA1149]MRW79530.1 hypothetical protein [Haloferax marinisediminis]MRW80451.1 hypothetical protein [Haloferax marinisediminis]
MSGALPGASPVGDASAEWSEDCDLTDSLLGAAWNTLVGTDTGCRWLTGQEIDYANVSATDAHATAVGIHEGQNSYLTTTNNFMQDTRSVAFMKAKLTLINELQNGSTEANATAAANATVEEYYSNIQYNLVQDYNQRAAQIFYLGNQTSVEMRHVYDSGSATVPSDLYRLDEQQGDPTVSSVLLENGTVIYATSIYLKDTSGYTLQFDTDPAETDFWVETKPPTGSYQAVFESDPYEQTYTDLGNQSTQVKSNIDVYATSFYSQYNGSEFNSTEVAQLDPTLIASQASTEYNSTGYYSYAAMQLAAMGASGDLNVSHTIEITNGTNTSTYEGTLFYTGSDASAGWDTNTTYNVTDYNGTLYFAYQNNNSSGIIDVGQEGTEFTLTSATNTDTGESVTTTVPQEYVYEETNASNLQEELDRLQTVRDEYEEAKSSSGSLDLGGGVGTEDKAIIAGAIVVLLLAVIKG